MVLAVAVLGFLIYLSIRQWRLPSAWSRPVAPRTSSASRTCEIWRRCGARSSRLIDPTSTPSGAAPYDAALAWESKVRLLTNNQRTVSACHDFVFSARDSWPPSAAWSPSTLLGPKEIQPTPDLSRGGLND